MSEPVKIKWIDTENGRRVVSIPMGAKTAIVMLEDVEKAVYIKIDNLTTMTFNGKWFGREVYDRFNAGLVELHELIDYFVEAEGGDGS